MRENIAKIKRTAYIMDDTNVIRIDIEYAKDERKVIDEVFLDNLPRTANLILNVLWDRNKAMTVAELTEAVNGEYETHLEKSVIQKFVRVLVNGDYVDVKRRGFRAYYQPLGMEYMTEEMFL